jgi:hypothetical protein
MAKANANVVAIGQTFTLPGVHLAAGVEQTFPASGGASTDQSVQNIALNVNLADADALNPATLIDIAIDRSADGGVTWDPNPVAANQYAGGPGNQRVPGNPIAMPGMSFTTGGAGTWRIRAKSAAALNTVSETVAAS